MHYFLFFSRFALILLVLQSSQLSAQKKKTVVPIIKSTTCWTYTIEDNSPKKAYQSSSLLFNKKGEQIASKDFYPNGLVANEYTYEYQKQQQDCYSTDGTGKKNLIQSEFYNEIGALIKRIRYNDDQSQLDALTVEYSNTQKVSEVYYNEQNTSVYSIQYSYDLNQKSIRENYTNHINEDQFIAAIDLDHQALPLAYSQYKSTGPMIKSIHYTRDDQGRVLTKETYSSNNRLQLKEVYEYGLNSKQYSVYIDQGKQLVEHVIYKHQYFE